MGSKPTPTPFARVKGLGSAKSGTMEFLNGRVTGVANGVLTLPVIGVFLALKDGDHTTLLTVFGNPIVVTVLLLFVATGVVHMKLGMQIIIEDYIHSDWRIFWAILNSFFAYGCGAVCAVSILMLAFAAR